MKSGREDLVEKVQHTTVEIDDENDIKSFSLDDTEKYIEIKTVSSNSQTPIYITQNELDFANSNLKNYYLYRVYEYNKKIWR